MAADWFVHRAAHSALLAPSWLLLDQWGVLRRISTASAAQRSPMPLPLSAGWPARSVGFMSIWPNYQSRIVHSRGRKLLAILRLRRWDAALEHDLTHSGLALGRRIVDEVIACIPSARLALQFYIWAGEQIGYPIITSRATGDVVQWWAGKAKLIPFLITLKALHQRNFDLTPAKVNVLIQGYGWAGMLERAFDIMLRTQSFANDILVKCLLHSVMREHRYDMVFDVYLEIKKHQTNFGLFFDELIQGITLGDCQKWEEADLLFKQATDSGHPLKDKTINNLIQAMSRAAQHERAYALLADTMNKKVRLESQTMVAVVKGLCHAKELQRASKVIEDCKQLGIILPTKVHEIFLQACEGKSGPDC